MSSEQAEASPVPVAPSGHDELDKVNFLNPKCHISEGSTHGPITPLSDDALKARLGAVLLTCHSALHSTKSFTEDYVSLNTK